MGVKETATISTQNVHNPTTVLSADRSFILPFNSDCPIVAEQP